jgi:hypothetical protein
MRTAEAVGGYVRKGIAVRAGKGYAATTNEKSGAEGFACITPNRLPLSQATMPNPIRGFRAWTYPDDDSFFEYVAVYRNEYRTVPSPAYDFPRCTITFFARQDSGGFRLLSERLLGARKQAKKKAENNQRNECGELSAVDWKNWNPPYYEPTEKELKLWRSRHWSKRTPHDPAAGNRKPLNLAEETRTDRETRARLNMYAYGSNGDTVQVEKMMRTAWENLRQSQKSLARYWAIPRRPAVSDSNPSYRSSAY